MSEHSPRIYKWMLMFLPVGVVVGTIVFMFMYFYMEREDERERSVIASYGLRMDDLEDMVGKFADRIGVRGHQTEVGQRGLKRAASMIEGRLGPQNVGYHVKKGDGEAIEGLQLKSLWVDLPGSSELDQIVIAAVSYAGAGETADANSVSTMMMLASSMAREKPAKTIRFVFLPLDQAPGDQNRWILEHCVGQGESCAGIVGIKTMDAQPDARGDDWEVVAPREQDKAWWAYLSQQGDAPSQASCFVWVSSSVFSSEAWQGRRLDRLTQTIRLASQIENWLRRAAN